MDKRQDKLGGNKDARQSASGFSRAINARYDLIDVWRDCNKYQCNYTWSGRNPTEDNSLIRTRIDFFQVTRAFKPLITSTDIRPYVHSDHDCISLTFDLEKVKWGPGYWHFNNELLTHAVFQAEIEFWMDWKQKFNEFGEPLQWWDKAKQNFKSIAIRRANIRRKVQCHEWFQLENRLKHTQELAKNGTTCDIKQYVLAKEKLKQLELKELESNKIQKMAQFMEEGEKSTHYFLSLEKSRRTNQTVLYWHYRTYYPCPYQGQLAPVVVSRTLIICMRGYVSGTLDIGMRSLRPRVIIPLLNL